MYIELFLYFMCHPVAIMPLLKQEQVWYSSCCHNGADQRIYDMKRINKKLGNPSLCSNQVLRFPSPVLLLIFHVLWLDI